MEQRLWEGGAWERPRQPALPLDLTEEKRCEERKVPVRGKRVFVLFLILIGVLTGVMLLLIYGARPRKNTMQNGVRFSREVGQVEILPLSEYLRSNLD